MRADFETAKVYQVEANAAGHEGDRIIEGNHGNCFILSYRRRKENDLYTPLLGELRLRSYHQPSTWAYSQLNAWHAPDLPTACNPVADQVIHMSTPGIVGWALPGVQPPLLDAVVSRRHQNPIRR